MPAYIHEYSSLLKNETERNVSCVGISVGNTIPDPGVPDIPEYGITKQ
jgi:hypothetical protein